MTAIRTYNLDPSVYDAAARAALDEILDEVNACSFVISEALTEGKPERARDYRVRRNSIKWTLRRLGYQVEFSTDKGYYDLA